MSLATALLKSFLTVIVWIPYALRLLNANITKKRSISDFDGLSESDFRRRETLARLEQRLAQTISESSSGLSVFEIREVVERYAGLTLAQQIEKADESDFELFRITNHQNAALGAKCLARRNRFRLVFHQKLARQDFVKILKRCASGANEKLRNEAVEFVTILNDDENLAAVEKLFAETSQTESGFAVNATEKAVWNSKEQKTSTAQTILAPLRPLRRRALTLTASSRSKD